MKRSRCPDAHEAAAGPLVRMPPSDCQEVQAVPFQAICQSALSVPFPKMSIRFAVEETTPGSDVIMPPSESQPLHTIPPDDHLCHTAPSVPRTNTSSRPEAHEATDGPEVRMPPRSCQG